MQMIRSGRLIGRAAVVGLLMGATVVAGGCRKQADAAVVKSGPEPVVVTLQPTKVQPVRRTVEVVGTLFGDEETVISAKAAGRVVRARAEMGDRVDPGQTLAQIDPTDYEMARTTRRLALAESLARLGLTEMPPGDFDPAGTPAARKARLQRDNSEAKYLRARKLFEKQPPLISEQDFADLRTAHEVAQTGYEVELLMVHSALAEVMTRRSDLDAAEQRLADTSVRAPGSEVDSAKPRSGGGRYAVAGRLVSVGEYVREGTPLFRLVASDPVKFRPKVPERYLTQVQIGQEIKVSVEGLATPFTGKIARVSPQIDAASRAFEIEAVVPNAANVLKPGAFARGSILVRADNDVTLVPIESVVSYAGTHKVFTVAGGKAAEVIITPGRRQGDYVEVIKGLRGSQEVVSTGAGRLAPGAPVVVKTLADLGGATASGPATEQPAQQQSAQTDAEVVQ
jgi:RND family efflux transporter MFP subunit